MSALQLALVDYLAIRRHLGTGLRTAEAYLRSFVAFVEEAGLDHITTALALRWATLPAGAHPAAWCRRLGIVRRFAAWRQATDPRTEVAPPGLLAGRRGRRRPYVYRDEEIDRLIGAARGLTSRAGLRALTYSTLFALLAVTGMRVGEAVALERTDVDLKDGILTIRRGKFGKSRHVPVHASTRDALQAYAVRRDEIAPVAADQGFFVSEAGTRITDCSARYNFAIVSREAGLRFPAGGHRHGRGPRLHDLRHHFASRTLLDWYRTGRDVEREIPRLATYLGHVNVKSTYWYLEAVPELLELATERLTELRPQRMP